MRRDERWKYVYYTDANPEPDATPGVKRPAEELDDAIRDPDEQTNLAGDPVFADALAQQRSALLAYQNRIRSS